MNPEYIQAAIVALKNIEADPSPANVLLQCATVRFAADQLEEDARENITRLRQIWQAEEASP